MSVSRAVILGALALPLAAQSPSWSLEEGQAVLYERTHEREIVALEPPPGPDDRRPRPSALLQPHNGGVLFHAELDAKRRTPTEEPREILAFLPRIAFDLRTFKRGKVREEFDLVHPFGTLRVHGEADRPEDDGSQELRLDVERVAPSMRGRGAGQAGRSGHDVRATLIIRRHFDATRGLIEHFEATLEGTLTSPGSQPWTKAGFRMAETWSFREIATADSSRLRERIGIAIRNGVDALEIDIDNRLRRLEDSPPPEGEGIHVDHLAGELALGLLTLVKGGRPSDDRLVQRSYAALRSRQLHDTYTLGVTLMAFEALYADPNERENLVEGRLDRPQPRTPTAEDKALMQGWVDRLLDNRDTRVDRGYVSRWTYNGGAGFDNSNSQYALLGLYSAQLCGIEIPASVWWGAGEHFVDQQCPSEGNHPLSLVTRNQLRREGKVRRTTTRTPARGWSYTYANAPAYGSMTTAGIAGLTICLAGLRDAGIRSDAQIGAFRTAIRSGWAWLGRNFRVRDNAGNPAQHAYWRFYYLYGLERACELSQIAQIDRRDWYFEGASILLEMQDEDGDFDNASFVDSCFAILFLKKASLPVFTGGE